MAVKLRVTDVERVKKKARKLAAGRVLEGGRADICLDLVPIDGCTARISAGYGALSKTAQSHSQDRLIWLLDGYVEVHDSQGKVTYIRQGECTVLVKRKDYRLVFPQLSIYLQVEAKK